MMSQQDPKMPSNGLAPQLEAHEDRLQRVEIGVADLRVKVAEVSVKQDLHHQHVISKLDALAAEDEKVEAEVKKLKKEEHGGKLEGVWEFVSKAIRKYAIHILVGLSGGIAHVVYTWFTHHHL